jgi:hypothetical protein
MKQLTPEQYLETHDLTRMLTSLGVTEEQRRGMRFRRKEADFPFDLRSFAFPDDLPGKAIFLVKAYCALKWLTLEDPSYSRDKEDAWRLVGETMAASIFAKTRNARGSERKSREAGLATKGRPRGRSSENWFSGDAIVTRRPKSCGVIFSPYLEFWDLIRKKSKTPRTLRNSHIVITTTRASGE